MIKDASVAGRYARALQILTEKQAAKAGRAHIPLLEQTLEELQGLAQLLAHGTRLGKFVRDPQISPADRLHRELERFTGKKIVLESLVDAALVGGAYVRIGDRVIDRSVRSLLGSLAQQLYEVSV